MNFFLYSIAGAVVIVGASFVRGDRDKYPQVCFAVGFVLCVFFLGVPQAIVARLHPHTMDLFLYRIDRLLHLDPLSLGRYVYSHTWLTRLLLVCRDSIPLVASIFYAFERPPVLVKAAVIATLGAFVSYNLFPAVGPAHAFAGFPWEPAKMQPSVGLSPRDCMPSMHLGWALLLAWNARGYPLKTLGWIFVGLNALAAVGSGEHYYIDLIVAVPFCWLAQSIAEKKFPLRKLSVNPREIPSSTKIEQQARCDDWRELLF